MVRKKRYTTPRGDRITTESGAGPINSHIGKWKATDYKKAPVLTREGGVRHEKGYNMVEDQRHKDAQIHTRGTITRKKTASGTTTRHDHTRTSRPKVGKVYKDNNTYAKTKS